MSVHSATSIIFLVLLHLASAQTVSTNAQLFQYGITTDDMLGPFGDDSSSPPLTLITPFTFFGEQHTEIVVNSNGVVSFGNMGFTDFEARPFPFESPPLIAPFWDDFNPSDGGMIYYRQTNDSDQLQLFSNYTLLLEDDVVENDYNPTRLFIATWDRVPPYGYSRFGIRQNQSENTFQVVLATNGRITLAVFLYADIQWGDSAQIGFNSGDGNSFFMLNEALTGETVSVDERSNVERPGVFIFRIDNLSLVKCSETMECTNSTLGLMTATECCIGNSDGVAYTKPGSEECHVCIVFGWLQDSFTGVEQADHHVVMAGYLKGAQEARSNLAFTINGNFLTGRSPSSGDSTDFMVLTSEVRFDSSQTQEVQVRFLMDGIAQEFNESITLELEPLPTMNVPIGEAVFFLNTIDMTIIDGDILDISLTMDEYTASEADGEMVITVCKDKPTDCAVDVMIASETVDTATIYDDLPLNFIPNTDANSPNRASQQDFDSRQDYMYFYGSVNCHPLYITILNDDINEANEQVFVIQLTLIYSLNSNLITLSRNVSLGIIIDDDPIRIGFEQQNYTFTKPSFLRSFMIKVPLVKEGGRLSEQTFMVQLHVSNMTDPLASLNEDYYHQIINITFLPNQQTVLWEFELLPNEENEAFRIIISSVEFPNFLSDSQDVFNEALVVINDPQSLAGFIQDIYTVHEDEGFINISIFSVNSSLDVVMNFTTVDHTAMEGKDYEQISTQLSLAGNLSTAVINIPIINDDLAEGLEIIDGMLQVISPPSSLSSVSIIHIEIIDDEDRGVCGNAVPVKGDCSADALCKVSANGRRLLNCSCKDGFLGTGPICRDINECETGQHNCHTDANCSDTFGGYECQCKEGFFGDGQICINITNKVPEYCDQVSGNCTCFNHSNGSVECGCNLGYEKGGSFLCQDVNECIDLNPCGNGSCKNIKGSYECFCPAGYIFDSSGKVCSDLDECLLGVHNCDRNAFCFNNDGSYECTCKGNYFGNGSSCFDKDECDEICDQRCIETTNSNIMCGCRSGYYLSSDLKTCKDLDECKLKISKCAEDAECSNTEGSYECQCKIGFQGNGIVCIDIDECDTGLHDCSENANCNNSEGSFTCTCKESFFGDGTECNEGFRPVIQVSTASTLVFPNNQLLNYSIGRNFCLEENNTIPHEVIIDCPLERMPFPSPQFDMNVTRIFRNGTMEILLSKQVPSLSLLPSQLGSLFEEDTAILRITCNVSNSFGSDQKTTDIRMCDLFECQDGVTNNCTQVCTRNTSDGMSSYECSCNAGYVPNENHSNRCDDFDECVNGSFRNCSEAENEICQNTIGSFTCECMPGFEINEATEICVDVNECTRMLHNCSENGKCINERGGFNCKCNPGFSEVGGICDDIDECLNSTLNNCTEDGQLCENTHGSYRCDCQPGFTENHAGVNLVCEDVNECASTGMNNCSQMCTNTKGSYQCSCEIGYNSLDPSSDNYTCQDVDECNEGIHNCHSDAKCINNNGSFICQCKLGHDGDGITTCQLSVTLLTSSTLGSLSFLLVIGIVGTIICFIKRHSQVNKKKRSYLIQLSERENEYGKFTSDRQAFSVQSSFKLKLSPHLIIKAANIKLIETIGQGEFGVVYKGHIVKDLGQTVTEVVAIKTLKGFYDRSTIREMLKECTKMHKFDHPNVLTLRGVCLDGGPAPYIIMPFMANGSLLAYLRKNRGTLTVSGKEQSEADNVCKQLTDMCIQVAKGMEYLASVKMVHRDLAARNCMIDMNFVIKVADFGLSESVGSKEYFRQDKDASVKLPLKWLAPESIEDGVFSEKSDVWAYGVTCWEIFSVGKNPYPSINVSDLPKLLADGQRLEKPRNDACHDEMYKFMHQCWELEPESRPSFSSLVKSLSTFLESIADYMDFNTINSENHHGESKEAEIEINSACVVISNC